ncbi:5388_t:CDS:2 [Entrophospora sp. SA101]|nr:5388_t:CDS:2 [Entrophospora sp. SA101]
MTIYSNPAVARQTIDPQATDKLTAYREAFNNAPGKVQANRGRVAGEALYPYDITVLLKSQAQFIHDFQGTAPSALSNTQILDYQGRGGIIPTYTSYGQTTNNFNPTEVLKNHLDHSHYSLTNLATENNFNMLYDYTLLPLVLPLNANLPAGRRAEDIIGMAYEKAYDVLLNSIQTAPDMESINLLVPQMQDLIRVCNEDNIQLPAGKNQAALQIARTDRIAAIQAAANPHPQPQTYTAQAIFEEQEQENVVIDNGKGNQPEKDQKPTKNKITTTEQVKLVQETITKVAQAQKSQVYSPELHHWLIEQKENNPQIYQMVNAHQQQIEKAIQHLEQLRVQKQAGQIRSRTKEGKQ